MAPDEPGRFGLSTTVRRQTPPVRGPRPSRGLPSAHVVSPDATFETLQPIEVQVFRLVHVLLRHHTLEDDEALFHEILTPISNIIWIKANLESALVRISIVN